MVSWRSCCRSLALLTGLLVTTGARADGILEKMQDEVAAISSKARSAVVTIEDGRLLLGSRLDVSRSLADTLYSLRSDYANVSNPAHESSQTVDPFLARTHTPPVDGQAKPGDGTVNSIVPPNSGTKLPVLGDLKVIGPLFQSGSNTTIVNAFTRSQPPKSGSGFSIGDGYIVTTADVLEGMENPVVITDTGTRIKSTIIGIDSELNIGLLRLAAKVDLPALPLGKSSAVRVGHFALSIANQAGQSNSVALMLIGNLKTEGTTAGNRFYPSLIQIAGTIGAGASGAPLLNVRGEVIGIIAGTPAGDESQIYVNPASPARTLFPGRSTPRGGASGKAQPPKRTSGLGQKSTGAAASSTPVIVVSPQGTAQALTFTSKPSVVDNVPTAYVQYGNTLVRTGDATLASPQINVAGATVQDLYRTAFTNGYTASTLRPVITSAGLAIPIDDILPIIEDMRAGKRQVHVWLGVNLKDIIKNVEQNGIVQTDLSVQINQIYAGSPAHKEGLLPGDVLVSLNGTPVNTGNEVKTHLTRLRPGDPLMVTYKRGETTHSVEIRMEPRPATTPEVVPAPAR